MAQYTVKDSQTGKTVTFNWNGKSAPTEQDMTEVFAEANKSVSEPSLLDRFKTDISRRISDNDTWGEFKQNTGVPILDNVLKALPVVGAGAGATLGIPAMPVGGPVIGAGVGGASGKSLENVIRRFTGIGERPTSPVMSPIKTGAEMATWEAGAPALLKVLSKMGGPAAEEFAKNTEGQALQKFSEKYDLPMSPSTIQPPGKVAMTEQINNLFPLGQWKSSQYKDELFQKMLDLRGKMLGELTGTEKVMQASPSFSEAVRGTKTGLRQAEKDAYAEIVPEIGGKNARIPMDNTRQLVDDLLESARIQRNPEMAKLLEKFNQESVSGLPSKSFYDLQAKVNTVAAKNKDYDLASDIWTAMNKDIKIFDETQGKNLSEIVKKGKETHQEYSRYDKIAGIFQKSSSIKDGAETFYPDKFYSLVMNDANQKYFAKEFGKDSLENLKLYAEHMRKIGMELKKRQLSDTQKMWQQTGVGAKIAGSTSLYFAAGGGVPGAAAVIVPNGMSYVIAKSIMSPKGVFKKWLTEGFKGSKTAAEALKVGGRAAIAENNE